MEEQSIFMRVRNSFLNGKPIILVDEEREVEADLVFPAELITGNITEFMVRYGKGLFCTVGPHDELIKRGFFKLPSNYGANYFIPIDYPLEENSTGIPTYERALTCNSISDNSKWANQFKYPGHVTLIGAIDFSKRKGHSESSVELLKICDFKPYSAIVEILDESGDSHNFHYIDELSKQFDLIKITIRDVWKEYIKNEQLINIVSRAKLPTDYGEFEIISFDNRLDYKEHFALVKEWHDGTPLVRIHSECITGDCLSSIRCDCGSQLENALSLISTHGGILIYLRQEGRGIGFTPKISAYALQDRGYDTYEANVCLGFKPDERDYASAFQMLRALGIHRIRLLSNNPDKRRQLNEYGLEIDVVENLYGRVTEYNKEYIATKISKFHHNINIEIVNNSSNYFHHNNSNQ